MALRSAIRAIRSYLPEQLVTNEDLANEFADWDVQKIYEKTGIGTRAVVANGECASDLGVRAAQKLFDDAICRPEDVDMLLFCTQSPDYFLPTTACLVQAQLGLSTDCGAVDINQGCSGFVYGLALAKGLIESAVARNVLFITAETYSKYIHPKDRSVRTIFGDAAAATLVSAVETSEEPLGPFVLGTDGRGARQIIVPAGAARMPRNEDTEREHVDEGGNVRSANNLYMNGPEIFTFTLRAVPALVSRTLQKAGLTLDAVDYFVFHQANRFMLEQLRKKTGIPSEKFCINLENCGNTVSATIPMALEKSLSEGRIKCGDRVMLVGFGVGYSWGAALIRVV